MPIIDKASPATIAISLFCIIAFHTKELMINMIGKRRNNQQSIRQLSYDYPSKHHPLLIYPKPVTRIRKRTDDCQF